MRVRQANHVCLKSSYKSSSHASSSSYGHDDAHHALKDKLNIKLSCREKPSFVKFKRESKCLSRESFLNIDFFFLSKTLLLRFLQFISLIFLPSYHWQLVEISRQGLNTLCQGFQWPPFWLCFFAICNTETHTKLLHLFSLHFNWKTKQNFYFVLQLWDSKSQLLLKWIEGEKSSLASATNRAELPCWVWVVVLARKTRQNAMASALFSLLASQSELARMRFPCEHWRFREFYSQLFNQQLWPKNKHGSCKFFSIVYFLCFFRRDFFGGIIGRKLDLKFGRKRHTPSARRKQHFPPE